MRSLPPTRIVGAVLMGADDARMVAETIELFSSHLSERGSRLAPRIEELAKALHIAAGTESDADATSDATSLATLMRSRHDSSHDLLDSHEAARLLGCTASNARALAQRGTLEARLVGGRWLFAGDAVRSRAAQH